MTTLQSWMIIINCHVCAGRKGGLDMNVLSAYASYGEQMQAGEVELSSVYWIMAQKPPPGQYGGCEFHDLTYRKRDREYDCITFENASKRARDMVSVRDSNACDERDNVFSEVLAAATDVHMALEEHKSDSEDEYDGVDLFMD